MRTARRDGVLPVPHAMLVNLGSSRRLQPRPAASTASGHRASPFIRTGWGRSAATPASSPPLGRASNQPPARRAPAEAGRLDRVRQPQLLRILLHPSRHSIEKSRPALRRSSSRRSSSKSDRSERRLRLRHRRNRSAPASHHRHGTGTSPSERAPRSPASGNPSARRSESGRRQAEALGKKPGPSPDAGRLEVEDE